MPKIMELNFITGNKGKLKEVSAILQDVITLRNQDLDLLEIQGTIEEVTKAKCNQAADLVKGPVLVEDTALIFHALTSGKPGAPELPGPYIKWFLKGMGVENLPKLLDGFEDKSAEAVCTFAFSAGPGSEPALFQGRASGNLVPPRGPRVFGWDAAFEYEGQTYAEMDPVEKNKISHRGRALQKLQEWLKSQT